MSSLININSLSNVESLKETFLNNSPIPLLSVNNFLKEDVAKDLYNETNLIDECHWTTFTRKGSHMKECTKMEYAPVASTLVANLHSSTFLKWLSAVTGIMHLIPDPHLVGAGYSKSFSGDTLQVHTDFNWNDQLKLHRALSLIIYLTPNWQSEWGGALDFYSKDRTQIKQSITCDFNKLLIWKYDSKGFHGYETPLSCPKDVYRSTFRLFYYVSNSQYNPADPPHRSLYWYDQSNQTPYDIRSEK
jgi:hypothetical protein